jgi:predicted heme/steroid binding protein
MVGSGDGEGSATWFAFGPQPELAATGRRDAGGLHGRPWGGGLRVGVQGSGAYIAKGEPPSDQWMDGSALGTHMAGQRGTNRWSLACSYGESVLEAFPAFEASGGEP